MCDVRLMTFGSALSREHDIICLCLSVENLNKYFFILPLGFESSQRQQFFFRSGLRVLSPHAKKVRENYEGSSLRVLGNIPVGSILLFRTPVFQSKKQDS